MMSRKNTSSTKVGGLVDGKELFNDFQAAVNGQLSSESLRRYEKWAEDIEKIDIEKMRSKIFDDNTYLENLEPSEYAFLVLNLNKRVHETCVLYAGTEISTWTLQDRAYTFYKGNFDKAAFNVGTFFRSLGKRYFLSKEASFEFFDNVNVVRLITKYDPLFGPNADAKVFSDLLHLKLSAPMRVVRRSEEAAGASVRVVRRSEEAAGASVKSIELSTFSEASDAVKDNLFGILQSEERFDITFGNNRLNVLMLALLSQDEELIGSLLGMIEQKSDSDVLFNAVSEDHSSASLYAIRSCNVTAISAVLKSASIWTFLVKNNAGVSALSGAYEMAQPRRDLPFDWEEGVLAPLEKRFNDMTEKDFYNLSAELKGEMLLSALRFNREGLLSRLIELKEGRLHFIFDGGFSSEQRTKVFDALFQLYQQSAGSKQSKDLWVKLLREEAQGVFQHGGGEKVYRIVENLFVQADISAEGIDFLYDIFNCLSTKYVSSTTSFFTSSNLYPKAVILKTCFREISEIALELVNKDLSTQGKSVLDPEPFYFKYVVASNKFKSHEDLKRVLLALSPDKRKQVLFDKVRLGDSVEEFYISLFDLAVKNNNQALIKLLSECMQGIGFESKEDLNRVFADTYRWMIHGFVQQEDFPKNDWKQQLMVLWESVDGFVEAHETEDVKLDSASMATRERRRDNWVDNEDLASLLHVLVREGHHEGLEKLKKQGVSLLHKYDRSQIVGVDHNRYFDSTLNLAIANQDVVLVKDLLEEGSKGLSLNDARYQIISCRYNGLDGVYKALLHKNSELIECFILEDSDFIDGKKNIEGNVLEGYLAACVLWPKSNGQNITLPMPKETTDEKFMKEYESGWAKSQVAWRLLMSFGIRVQDATRILGGHGYDVIPVSNLEKRQIEQDGAVITAITGALESWLKNNEYDWKRDRKSDFILKLLECYPELAPKVIAISTMNRWGDTETQCVNVDALITALAKDVTRHVLKCGVMAIQEEDQTVSKGVAVNSDGELSEVALSAHTSGLADVNTAGFENAFPKLVRSTGDRGRAFYSHPELSAEGNLIEGGKKGSKSVGFDAMKDLTERVRRGYPYQLAYSKEHKEQMGPRM